MDSAIIDPSIKPKFSLGERVRLVSQDYPEKNGIYYIDGMTQWWNQEDNTRTVIWAYTLAGVESHNFNNLWNETALRKLPPKGKSFDEIMGDLKLPVGEPV
ncbi:hypothetical protein ACRXCV_00110 (plasmid) [Halobacteriovorax sp. GFR7]|uniref:hypothetical protein n=1 Tax=unclassified Halobacteriovorax TaxID=2639665 RepID=UPI003D972228